MIVHFRMLISIAVLAFIGCGCATAPGLIVHLNDPVRSQLKRDVVNLFASRNVLYETLERGGISVGYNLFFAKNANVSGYRLTLIFKNNTASEQPLKPVVSLRDGAGVLIRPYSYRAFAAKAATLAGTVVPPEPFSCECINHYTAGTIGDAAVGGTDSYPTTPTDTPQADFIKGMPHDAVSGAMNDREGILMLLWANSFWLKEAYNLPAGAESWGALFFPATDLGEFPLHLTVKVGGQEFEFDTVATITR